MDKATEMSREGVENAVVIAVLDYLKGRACSRDKPLVATPGKLCELLIESGCLKGGSFRAGLPVTVHHARRVDAALVRAAPELFRRGVYVERARSARSFRKGAPPHNSFRIWRAKNAVLAVKRALTEVPPQPAPMPRGTPARRISAMQAGA